MEAARMHAEAVKSRAPCPEQINFPGFEIHAEDTVVDIGCGFGEVCAYAGHVGAAVVGIDIDPDCLERTESVMRGTPARSWQGLLSRCDPIPLPDSSASVIVCTEVLEHVDDPFRLAAELARIGRPGARYLISVPDPRSESAMEAVAPAWNWEPPYHRRIFEHEQLDALLTGAGLEIEGRAFSGFFWALWWAFRMAAEQEVVPFSPTPDSPLLKHWEAAWTALGQAPRGPELARELHQLLPKSQIRIARKPCRNAKAPSPASSIAPRRPWRQRFKTGSFHFGRLNLRWSIHRVNKP
jgi:SAM-dependent methyltransferase